MSSEDRRAYELAAMLETPIAEMGLPVRIVNALESEGILLVHDLLARSRESLLAVTNFGEKTIREIVAAVKSRGLTTPKDWAPPRKSRKKSPKRK